MYASGVSNLFRLGLSQLRENQQQVQQSLQRLATGRRVNRAGDDPGAIAPIERHKAEMYTLNKKLDSIAQHEGFLGAKEGGLSVVNDLLIELKGIVVQFANAAGNGEAELDALQIQANAIIEGIDNIAVTTTFKGQAVLSEYTIDALDDDLSSIASLLGDDPEKAQETIEQALDRVNETRAVIGSQLREYDSRKRTIMTDLENLNASLSSMQDTDYASETAELVRAQILESASYAAIDISRHQAAMVLDLIRQSTDEGTPALIPG